jgi:hypothetical protein
VAAAVRDCPEEAARVLRDDLRYRVIPTDETETGEVSSGSRNLEPVAELCFGRPVDLARSTCTAGSGSSRSRRRCTPARPAASRVLASLRAAARRPWQDAPADCSIYSRFKERPGMRTLKIVTGDSMVEHTLLKRGATLRFAVGRPFAQSSIWQIFAAKGAKKDIYVVVRAVRTEWKFSLHESGVWRYAEAEGFSGAVGESPLLKQDDRVLYRWSRPTSDEAWIHGFTIQVPDGYLGNYEEDDEADKVTWLPAPSVGHFISVSLGICYGGATSLHPPDSVQFIGGLELGEDGAIVLVSTEYSLDAGTVSFLADKVAWPAAERLAAESRANVAGRTAAARTLLIDEEHPTPLVWDLYAGPIEPS